MVSVDVSSYLPPAYAYTVSPWNSPSGVPLLVTFRLK
jgi:hypothetical protein